MAMKLPTLYKLKKKLLVWEIETLHPPLYNKPVYKITFGQKGGKMQETITEVPSGKNIGKANETTPEEQCDLEAKSLWQKQIDRKGYSTGIKQLDNNQPVNSIKDIVVGLNGLPSPMLAVEYEKFAHKVKFPCYVQPKLDGVRCLAYLENGKVVLLSRQRKEFNHLSHIRDELLPALKEHTGLILDGELYSHKYSFQEIISAIKRDTPNNLTEEIEYHVYDIVNPDKFFQRLDFIHQNIYIGSVKPVDTKLINSLDNIDYWHNYYTKRGYEGLMIRNKEGLYKQDGRSQDLLKYKKFIDQEFPIVGASQNKGKLSNTCTFRCECNGTTFDVMPEGSEAERAQLYKDWKNGVIKKGDLATVKFFSWSTSVPQVPRFPIMKGVRSYE